MMKSFLSKAWTAITNPGQDERVAQILGVITQGFRTHKMQFELAPLLEPIDCTKKDVEVACLQYYQNFAGNYWSKGIPDAKQIQLMQFVAGKLNLTNAITSRVQFNLASQMFGRTLRAALMDGLLDADEISLLNCIASASGHTLQEFVRFAFQTDAISMLSETFADAGRTGKLDKLLWENLQQSMSTLGIDNKLLQAAVRPLASNFAVHVLADIQSEGDAAVDDHQYLDWLISTFGLSGSFRLQVDEVLSRLQKINDLKKGRVPSLPLPTGVNFKSGELVHFRTPATMSYIRKRTAAEDKTISYEGHLYMTDHRILFQSSDKPQSIAYRALVSYQAFDHSLVIGVKGKPEITYRYRASQELAALLAETVIRLHSQLLTRKIEGGIDRKIPRDVRQRVWQNYGGKCADCGAGEYLEFDHIVPVAKGGSNSEQNVQLLCRKCNLAKSDRI